MKFAKKKLIWKLYSISKILLITKWVQLIDYKEFAITALNLDEKAFIVYVAYLGAEMLIYLIQKA